MQELLQGSEPLGNDVGEWRDFGPVGEDRPQPISIQDLQEGSQEDLDGGGKKNFGSLGQGR